MGGFGHLDPVNMAASLAHDFVKPGREWVGLADRGCLIYPKADVAQTGHSRRRHISILCIHSVVTGAPCRMMDPKVSTAPKTQSPLTIKVEIKIKFNSIIKR